MTYFIGTIPCESTAIRHWGLLGMKWGARRFRNRDGTLTAEGKKRYGRKPSEMSDDELRSSINRLRMETEYSRLEREKNRNSPIGKAMAAGKTVANQIGRIAGTVAYNTIVPFANSLSRELGTGLGKLMTGNRDSGDKKKKKSGNK